MSIKDIDVDESQTGGYSGRKVVMRREKLTWPFALALLAFGFLFFFFVPSEFSGRYRDLSWGNVLVFVMICAFFVFVMFYRDNYRTIEFNDEGISVNGAAVIPWSRFDEVVYLYNSNGPSSYKFRYSSYDGEISYLSISSNMTNMQEAIKFAHKKLPGKFGDKFSQKPKTQQSQQSQPNVYISNESDYTSDYQDVIEDIDEDFSDDFSQKQRSPSDFYIDGEIVVRSTPLSGKIVISVIVGFTTFICLFMYFSMREPGLLFVSFVVVILWIDFTFWDKKIIFCNDGIIEKQSKPLIRWDDIYAVDIELAAYVFKYTAHDWGEHSLRLPFKMQNIRKGIEAAKKKLPNLFE